MSVGQSTGGIDCIDVIAANGISREISGIAARQGDRHLYAVNDASATGSSDTLKTTAEVVADFFDNVTNETTNASKAAFGLSALRRSVAEVAV